MVTPWFSPLLLFFTIMAVCNQCFDGQCAHSINLAADCNCPEWPAMAMLNGRSPGPQGSYNVTARAVLPVGIQSLDPVHIDALTSYVEPGVAVPILSAAAIALFNGGAVLADGNPWYNDVDGTNPADIISLVSIFKVHASRRAEIMEHLCNLEISGANAAAIAKSKTGVVQCRAFSADIIAAVPSKPKTDGAMEDVQSPLARLYLKLTKAHLLDPLNTLSQITMGKFSMSSGAAITEFETLRPVVDAHLFHMIVNDFLKAIYATSHNGGSNAWKPFLEFVYELLRANRDVRFVHEFIFKVLKDIDRIPGMNIVRYMAEKVQTSLHMFSSMFGENFQAAQSDSTAQPIDQNNQEITKEDDKPIHVRFGPVTITNQASGEMRTRNGAVAFCNAWNQNQPCNRGVFTGRNKGKCAYTHRCRYCKNTAAHRAEDKDGAGAWVCPKHP